LFCSSTCHWTIWMPIHIRINSFHVRIMMYIITLRLKVICPQIRIINIFQVRRQVFYIKSSWNIVFTRKVNLVIIIILTLSTTWNDPSSLGINLDFPLLGNLSLLRWIQTRSPSSNLTIFLPLLACLAYFVVFSSIWDRTYSLSFFSISTFFTPSIEVLSSIEIGIRSIGMQGLKPYTTLNGEKFIAPCTLQL